MSDTKQRNREAERDGYQLPPTRNIKRVKRQQLPSTQVANDEYIFPIREDEDYLRLAANMLR